MSQDKLLASYILPEKREQAYNNIQFNLYAATKGTFRTAFLQLADNMLPICVIA